MKSKVDAHDISIAPHFLNFSRDEWKKLRMHTPLTLTDTDLENLHGQIESLAMKEVEEIYLPLSRLLNLYVSACRSLHAVSTVFLGTDEPKVPYVIGIAGSVAVGKSTVSRILRALLSQWPDHPKVEIVTTDGYLYPNSILEKKGLMKRKGFPESYDLKKLVRFLSDLKAGIRQLQVPIYSHSHYDIIENEFNLIDQPDIVIVEGLNVLQSGVTQGQRPTFVSDFFDFSIYVDAKVEVIKQWYIQRFMSLREKSKNSPHAFFHRFAHWTEETSLAFANEIWSEINQINLTTNILPYRMRAKLILYKGEDHAVERVYLRKI